MTIWGNSAGFDAAPHQSTVFIVDDDPDVRRTLRLLVRSVDLAADTYASAAEFLSAYQPDQPGCLVLDMRLPGMSGRQLQQELTEREIDLPIIFITAHVEIHNATAALRDGAIDFLPKPFSPQVLLERIHEAIALDAKQRRRREQQERLKTRLDALTGRQREITQLLVRGESTKLIANRLGISPKTVDNHRSNILERVGVDNVIQLSHLVNRFDAIEIP